MTLYKRIAQFKVRTSFSSPWALITIMGLSPWPAMHLKGHSLMSACTMGSANLRPIKRLASKTCRQSKVALTSLDQADAVFRQKARYSG